MNLPIPEYGKTDKETIDNLMDTVMKLRKELEYVLNNIGSDNIPEFDSMVADGVNQVIGAYNFVSEGDLSTPGGTTINGGNIQTGTLSANTISGGTVTGITVRTAASGERIELNGSELSAFNASNQKHGFVMGKESGFNKNMGGFFDAGIQTLEFFNRGTLGYNIAPLNGARLGLGSSPTRTDAYGSWYFEAGKVSMGIKTGTLASKPSGLIDGELWFDTGNKIIVSYYQGVHRDALGTVLP